MHWSDPSRWRELLMRGADEDRERLRSAIRDNVLEEAAKEADRWAAIDSEPVGKRTAEGIAERIRSLKTNTNPKQEGK